MIQPMRNRRPRPPMWTDDPVRDADMWDAYLSACNEYDEDYEDEIADREYEERRDRDEYLRN